MVSAGAVTTIESACVSVAEGTCASATCAVKLYVPAVLGVPVMAPEEPFRDSPFGRLPEATDHAYGVTPPVAARVWL